MLFNTTRQRYLLSDLGTCRGCELNFRQIRLDAEYPAARGRRADVDEEELVLHELRNFRLLLVLGLHS